jgi:hypothetical protein
MGGSGGGGFFGGRIKPTILRSEIDAALGETERQKREVEIDSLLNDLLAGFNSRDYDKTSRYLAEIEGALGEEIDGMETILFGGSIAKHTYVDGLSDVDSLVILDREEIDAAQPTEMLAEFAKALRNLLPAEKIVSVTTGTLAVTVEYKDGMALQLLPAARHRSGFFIPDARGSGWRAIKPGEFTQALTQANLRLTSALVPTIKLAKSAMSNLSEDIRPTGYHIEALALRAFAAYKGDHLPRAMLPHFFRQAAEAVLRPVADPTGQSRHVDANLGPAGSDARKLLAASCERIARRLDGARSRDQWREVVEPAE